MFLPPVSEPAAAEVLVSVQLCCFKMAAVGYGAAPRMQYGAAPAVPVPQQSQQPQQPQETVPEIVVDKRDDHHGNIVIRRYKRGRVLGKVGRRGAARAAGWGCSNF